MHTFSLDDGEIKRLNGWLAHHNQTCPYYDDGTSPVSPQGAIGGAYTYSFTPTSIGMITVFTCACGGEINLTDYSMW